MSEKNLDMKLVDLFVAGDRLVREAFAGLGALTILATESGQDPDDETEALRDAIRQWLEVKRRMQSS